MLNHPTPKWSSPISCMTKRKGRAEMEEAVTRMTSTMMKKATMLMARMMTMMIMKTWIIMRMKAQTLMKAAMETISTLDIPSHTRKSAKFIIIRSKKRL
jgi:hypothetical protein